jgi:acyl-CoA dehydrogenase
MTGADLPLDRQPTGQIAPDYATIARLKATLVTQTGLLGMASVGAGSQLIARHFLGFGSEAQRREWQGKALSVAISEPKVGAHPKLLTTRADRSAQGFRISGQKAWVTNGPSADAIIVFAITAEDQGRKRYSAFIVPRDTPGLTLAEMPGFHALRPSRHCLVTLDQCAVPDSTMLGDAGSAYERMALPFRDIEDAVGTFAILGALRHAIGLFAGSAFREKEQAVELGAIAALTAVFAAGADAVVASLDANLFRTGDITLVGLRVLAIEIVARLRRFVPGMAVDGDQIAPMASLTALLVDLDATLSVAQGPRLVRQARIGDAAIQSHGANRTA